MVFSVCVTENSTFLSFSLALLGEDEEIVFVIFFPGVDFEDVIETFLTGDFLFSTDFDEAGDGLVRFVRTGDFDGVFGIVLIGDFPLSSLVVPPVKQFSFLTLSPVSLPSNLGCTGGAGFKNCSIDPTSFVPRPFFFGILFKPITP